MYTFQDFGIFVNHDTGIVAQNVSVNSSNSLSPGLTNAKNSEMNPFGPIKNEISIDYIPRVLFDPFLTEIERVNNLIDANSQIEENQMPFIIQVGNLSGSFFLSNYRIGMQPNNLLYASVSFVGYGALSGNGVPKTASSISLSENEIGHAYVTTTSNYFQEETDKIIYNLEYNYSKNLSPIYKIGSKEPIQVIASQTARSASFTFEDFYPVDFTGKALSDIFLDKTYIKLKGYKSLESADSQDGFSGNQASGDFDLNSKRLSTKGMKITRSSTQVSQNDIVKTTIQAESVK